MHEEVQAPTIPSVQCVTQKRARSPGSPYVAVMLHASHLLFPKLTCTSRSDEEDEAANLWPTKYAHSQKEGPQVP